MEQKTRGVLQRVLLLTGGRGEEEERCGRMDGWFVQRGTAYSAAHYTLVLTALRVKHQK